MNDLMAYAWGQLASVYHEEIIGLISDEEKQQENCKTGCCGLPMGEKREKLHGKAVRALQHSLEWSGGDPETYYNLYWNHHYLGQFEEGVEACRRALEIDPKHAHSAHALGICLKRLGRDEEAAEALERAIELDPDHADMYQTLVACLANLGREEEADRACDRGLKRFPDDLALMRIKFNTLEKAGKYENALSWAERAVALDANDYAPHVALGHAYLKLGKSEDAINSFMTAARLAPGKYYALTPLLDALTKAGRADEIPGLLEEQAGNPVSDHVDGLFLGIHLYEHGCFASAKRILVPVATAVPDFTRAHLCLAMSMKELGEVAAAARALETAVTTALKQIIGLEGVLPELRKLDKKQTAHEIRAADAFELHTYDEAIHVFLEAGDFEKVRAYLHHLERLDPEKAGQVFARLHELET